MSLVDLQSDLSKFRSNSVKQEKTTPASSKAKDGNNFANVTPVTDNLKTMSPNVNQLEQSNLEGMMSSTKLDDIKSFTTKPLSGLLGKTKLDDVKKFNTKPLSGLLSKTKLDDIKKFKTKPITDLLGKSKLDDTKAFTTTPIESKLEGTKLDDINPFTTTPIEKRLETSKLDDIVKKVFEEGLVNSVSKYSNIDTDSELTPLAKLSSGTIASKFAQIREENFESKLNKSEINPSIIGIGQNNLQSNIQPNQTTLTFDRKDSTPEISINSSDSSDNITDPKVEINRIPLSLDRSSQSVDITSRGVVLPNDDVVDPKVTINTKPLFNDLKPQSVIINKDLFSPLNNVLNPDIAFERSVLSMDKTIESPELFTDLPVDGFVTIPDTKIFKTDLRTKLVKDISDYNVDGIPAKYTPISKLMEMTPSQIVDTIRYDLESAQLEDNSKYNLDKVIKTIPFGRNEDPSKSKYSSVDTQEVNFFPDSMASGFTARQQLGDSKFNGDSKYGWVGKAGAAPSVNYMSDQNAKGFKTFVENNKTAFVINSSRFGFVKIPEVNYFDENKLYTKEGFKAFTSQLESAYIDNSSKYGWEGKTDAAPEVNYFDITGTNTTAGFTKFVQLYDSKYIPDSSVFDWEGAAPAVNYFDITNTYTTEGFKTLSQPFISSYIPDSSQFDWDGARDQSPEVNYFDLLSRYTTTGFTKFAQNYDSKYIQDASQFDWDGSKEQAPVVNYFDISNTNTTDGFTKFPQNLDSKYVPDSSQFDWDGSRENVPVVNYFDLTNTYTNDGFTSFSNLYDSKYIPDSSVFDWNGNKENVPTVNYFDLTNAHTNIGFHSFAAKLDSKYIKESSEFDWNGTRDKAPAVDYFDLTKRNTTSGFTTFHILHDSKYIKESSIFDWDGVRSQAPAVNYLDLLKQYTTEGFNTFTQFQITKYIPDSSQFDWNGTRSDAPAVDYFDVSKKNTTVGFHTFARKYESKYVPESSEFDWDGTKQKAPAVDYFDLTKQFTTVGFHTFARKLETKYIPESSEFDWDGTKRKAPAVNYFDLTKRNTTIGFHTFAEKYDTKYIPESSEFDWDGNRGKAPAVNYFDLSNIATSKGFHILAQQQEPTSYQTSGNQLRGGASIFDWDGSRTAAPEVNYFDATNQRTTKGFHKFAKQLEPTKYQTSGTTLKDDASEFDWNGKRAKAPEVDFFDLTKQFTTKGFHRLAEVREQTKYKTEASEFTFKGSQPKKGVNYFDATAKNAAGFTQKPESLQTEYKHESSNFGFTGKLPNPIDFFDNKDSDGFILNAEPLQSKFKEDTSRFTFVGKRSNAPSIDYIENKNAPGFNSFPPLLESKYDLDSTQFGWKGGRTSAPAIDFLDNAASSGFTTFAQTYQSFYTEDFGKYNWKGARSEAPNVSWFGITPKRKMQLPDLDSATRSVMTDQGFKTFFENKENTNLASSYSTLSTETGRNKSAINDIPMTNFFGYTPSTRNGFMIKMSSTSDTMYPIVSPMMKYDLQIQQRTPIQISRGELQGGLVKDRELYAPNAFGKKIVGSTTSGKLASLQNQVPDSKVKTDASYYGRTYEENVRNFTDKQGYVSKWALKRNSPSPLDLQYSKFNLRADAYNPDFLGSADQPFVLRDIGQRWGFGANFDEGLVRGGAVTMADRILNDVIRVGKFLVTGKGLLFLAKQVGLQLMNPNVDERPANGIIDSLASATSFGMSPTQIFNPAALIANTGGAPIGLRLPRHSLLGALDSSMLNRYGDTAIKREFLADGTPAGSNFKGLEVPESDGDQTDYSRLIGLMKELLPNSFKPNVAGLTFDYEHSKIYRISSGFGGTGAPLGIGGTKIRRATHPYLTYYTTNAFLVEAAPTTPPATTTAASSVPTSPTTATAAAGAALGLGTTSNPQYPKTALRNQYYNLADKNGDVNPGGSYSAELFNEYNKSGKSAFGMIKGLINLLPNGPGNTVSAGGGTASTGSAGTSGSAASVPMSLHSETINRIKGLNPFTQKTKTFSSIIKPETHANALNNQDIPLHKSNPIETDPLKKYLTSTYSNLRKADVGTVSRSRKYNDFRQDIYDSEVPPSTASGSSAAAGQLQIKQFIMTDPKIMRYHKQNLENFYGIGAHGEPGSQRNLPFVSNIHYMKDKKTGASVPVLKKGRQFRGDRINIIDYKQVTKPINKNLVYEKNLDGVPGSEDLVEFYFTGLKIGAGGVNKPAEVIVFRATFDNIQDTHSPKWNAVKYMGRGDPLYTYDGYERSISFGFTVHIGSRDEMKASWRKLNYLASWTAPDYTSAGLIRGPVIRLNIGHLYRKMPGFISSLSYTFDNVGGVWETAKLPEDKSQTVRTANNDATPNVLLSSPGVLQLPKTIQVSVGFTPFGVYRPEYNGVMYSLYDDGQTEGIESGLMPSSDTKVNYFRAIDTKDDGTRASVTDADNKALLQSPPPDGKEADVVDVDPKLRDETNDEKPSTAPAGSKGLIGNAEKAGTDTPSSTTTATDTANVPGNAPGTGVLLQSDGETAKQSTNSLAPNNLTGLGGSGQTQDTSNNFVMAPKTGTNVPADVPPKTTGTQTVVTDTQYGPAIPTNDQYGPAAPSTSNATETTGKTDKPRSKKKKKRG